MTIEEIKIPDIGDFKDIEVIEVLVKVGDSVKAEDSLLTLESDKATMEIPSPKAGVVKELKLKAGDKVSQGTLALLLDVTAGASAPAATKTPAPAPATTPAAATPAAAPAKAPSPVAAHVPAPAPTATTAIEEAAFAKAHASPSVRRFARELGVNLGAVKGTGPKNRIQQIDVQQFVKAELAKPRGAATGGSGVGLDLLAWPKVDFAKFGVIESVPLSRIKKLSGANLARNWVMIPHVTQFDEADITELEAFRKSTNEETMKQGAKVTILAYLIKASVAALKQFPDFNSSLDGDNLVMKKYFNIGFAADTPNGLVVPVLKNADQKNIVEIAKETSALALLAREGKLKAADMQGGCFSISSLGGIGGTAFTPIINAPEVAILGVSKSSIKPMWDGKEFLPKLVLPLSLSYDHRVIDGASAARFTSYMTAVLSDIRRLVL